MNSIQASQTLQNLKSTRCSYGEPKEGANADDHD